MSVRFALPALCAIALLASVSPARALDKNAKIRELMEVTKVIALSEAAMQAQLDQLGPMLAAQNPDMPPQVRGMIIDELRKEFQVLSQELPSHFLPLYAKHFSESEVDDILAFYKTTTGRKSIDVMPAVMQESMGLGQQLGQAASMRALQRVGERLKANGG